MSSRAQAGFSLIEALVAMTVLAVSATAILSATEAHTRSVTAIRDRMFAGWVAQDRMVELTLAIRGGPDVVSMGGLDWRVQTERNATTDPDLDRVDVLVSAAVSPDVIMARLTGFIDSAQDEAE